MNNTTVLPLSPSLESAVANDYDSFGAIIFIVVVLSWYASSIIFLLKMQTIASVESFEDSVRYSKRLFKPNFHEKTNNREILEELVDKEKRGKLWGIYWGTAGQLNDQINQADTLRIRNIQRRLAVIDENNRDDQGPGQSVHDNHALDVNIGSSEPDISIATPPLRVRREPPIDQQILEEWQKAVGNFNVSENWPWPIQRLLIQRHLRRRRQVKVYPPLRKRSIP